MAFRRRPDGGRSAVALLATAFVVLIGAVSTGAMVLSFSERSPWMEWGVWAGIFVGLMLLLKSLLGTSERGGSFLQLFWRRAKDDAELANYQPRIKSAPRNTVGTNQPPTVESVRRTASESVRWVPHGSAPERKRKKS